MTDPAVAKETPKVSDRQLAEYIVEQYDRTLPLDAKRPTVSDVERFLPSIRKLRQQVADAPNRKVDATEAMFIGLLDAAERNTSPGQSKPLVSMEAVVAEIHKGKDANPRQLAHDALTLDNLKMVGVERVELSAFKELQDLLAQMKKVTPKLEKEAQELAATAKGKGEGDLGGLGKPLAGKDAPPVKRAER